MAKRMWTTCAKHISALVRSDRGDIVVTPAVMALVALTTLVVGALAFYGTRGVAPKVNSARQGITLDDDGNIVSGAVGVIPVPSPTPEPTPKPKPHTRTIVEEQVVDVPAPQPGVVVGGTSSGVGGGGSSGSSSSSSSSSGGTSSGGGGDGGCCGGGHDGGGHHGG